MLNKTNRKSNKITLEEIHKIFNPRTNNVGIKSSLDTLIQYIRYEENFGTIVNNVVDYMREAGGADVKIVSKAWMKELNKILKGARLWETQQGKAVISSQTLMTSRVFEKAQIHYRNKTREYEPEKEVVPEKTEAELRQEAMNKRMAKVREAKRLKALERKALALAEVKPKTQVEKVVKDEKTGKLQELSEAELREIQELRKISF